MREHLYQGKRLDNGEWVEGNLFVPDEGYNAPTEICVGTNRVRITYDVDPDTVSEFIGLRDKNKKLIFEGNIIKVDIIGGGKRICEVGIGECYDTDGEKVFGVWAKYDENKLILPTASQYVELYEVIGNKWDNPELLEGGAE